LFDLVTFGLTIIRRIPVEVLNREADIRVRVPMGVLSPGGMTAVKRLGHFNAFLRARGRAGGKREQRGKDRFHYVRRSPRYAKQVRRRRTPRRWDT
jgi:hypothetical protein